MPELVRLESHDLLLKAIEFWITPGNCFAPDLGTSCRHPVVIAIGKTEELATLSQVSSGIGSAFVI